MTIKDRFCQAEVSYSVMSLSSTFLGPDINACQGDPVLLSSMRPGSNYAWSNGSSRSTLIPDASGIFWLDLTITDCVIRDSVAVTFGALPVFSLGSDTTLCEGQTMKLEIDRVADSFLWLDGTTGREFTVKEPGTYYATASIGQCHYADSIYVSYRPPPDVSLGKDTLMCAGNALTINLDPG